MAIKLPDPGNGIPEQKTGNDEWTNMKIVRDNFADQSNAASRLVGTASGNVMEVGAGGWLGRSPSAGDLDSLNVSRTFDGNGEKMGFGVTIMGLHVQGATLGYSFQIASRGNVIKWRGQNANTWGATYEFYHTGNTTVDSNKNIKTSSPVARVFSDRLDKIHEANDLPIKYIRNGVGDYTIEGTTGLRENDWQIVIPEDDHRNQLIAFTIEDDNGTIRLKTYKRTFSMETFTFGPDLSTPLDIPEGRWVDLHFNDLPEEQLDEPIE